MIRIHILKKIKCKENEKRIIAGIDEAGRGPVIGPMIIAYVAMFEEDVDKLVNIEIKDSKELTRARREELFEIIKGLAVYISFAKIYPETIDEWVSKKKGLNALEAYTIAKLLEGIDLKPVIFIDAPSNVPSYRKYMELYLGKKFDMIIETKADKKWPIVMAAGIVAKVIRDREIDDIKKKTGIDLGSGYPSDPKTKIALPEIIRKFPSLVRKTWKTYKKTKSEANNSLDKFIEDAT